MMLYNLVRDRKLQAGALSLGLGREKGLGGASRDIVGNARTASIFSGDSKLRA
jgi:hypothetical protein